MKFHQRIIAGTALGLLMTTAQLGAAPFAGALNDRPFAPAPKPAVPLVLAQAEGEECPAGDPDCAPAEEQPAEEEPAPPPAAAEPAPEEEAAPPPAEEAPAEPAAEEPAPPPAAEEPAEPAAEEAAPPPVEEEPAEPAAEEAASPPAEEEPAEPAAEEEPAPPPAAEPAPEEEAAPPPAEEAPAEPAAEEAAPPAEAEPAEPAAEEATPPGEEAPAEPAAEEAAPEGEAVIEGEAEEEITPPAEGEAAEPTSEEDVTPPPAGEEAAEPVSEEDAATPPGEEPAPQAEGEADVDVEGDAETAPEAEGEGEMIPEEDAAPEAGTEDEAEAETGADAPVLDSQKEQPAAEDGQAEAPAEEQPVEEAGPPPESDAAAQSEEIAPEELEAIIIEDREAIEEAAAAAREERAAERELSREERRARREEQRERRRERREERRERREDARVIGEYEGDRVIVEIENQIFIESPDYERIILEEDYVYYDDLSDGRVREVIIRPNDVRVVTIRNRYGDVIRRSKIYPNGEEVLLVYVPERYYDEVVEFRDPAVYLPPLRLDIPVEEYILEAETVQDPGRYYTFLDQPPVTDIERTYSLEEVKRSARVRDTMRRIDLDTINFEFGSAQITESEIGDIEAIAEAMLRMLDENPGETFLIEGHTDAVGSELANLALSDQRAENVARALTNVFGVPPENLVTQGYGEQYLKIETQDRSRENRRVAIRRITPLVAPVASAQ